MIVFLSNSIIRAYKKKTNFISFHLRGHLIFKTTVSFSIEAYLKDFSSFFILPDKQKIEFDDISIAVWGSVPFDGKYQVVDIHMSTISKLTIIESTAVDFVFNYLLNFTGHESEEMKTYESPAFIVKHYRDYKRQSH